MLYRIGQPILYDERIHVLIAGSFTVLKTTANLVPLV